MHNAYNTEKVVERGLCSYIFLQYKIILHSYNIVESTSLIMQQVYLYLIYMHLEIS